MTAPKDINMNVASATHARVHTPHEPRIDTSTSQCFCCTSGVAALWFLGPCCFAPCGACKVLPPRTEAVTTVFGEYLGAQCARIVHRRSPADRLLTALARGHHQMLHRHVPPPWVVLHKSVRSQLVDCQRQQPRPRAEGAQVRRRVGQQHHRERRGQLSCGAPSVQCVVITTQFPHFIRRLTPPKRFWT